jgi:hypothetical protein
MGSGESVQLGLSGDGWVLVQPSEGRQIVRSERDPGPIGAALSAANPAFVVSSGRPARP